MIAALDGCKDGWLIAITDRWPSENPVQLLYASDFASCLKKTSACSAVLVDMPIGLPSGSEERSCDAEAREFLSGGSSSVFRTPPRSVLQAATPEEFQRQYRAIVGKGAGLPVWGIVPKLLEVDRKLSDSVALQERVYEFHPELAWRRLAGRKLNSKHSAVGLLQRLSALDRAHPDWLGDAHELNLSKGVQLDDVLDAVVGLSVAQAIVDGTTPARRFPVSQPPVDDRGLRMEIWY
jgi:predicted RNase H-like nuclease